MRNLRTIGLGLATLLMLAAAAFLALPRMPASARFWQRPSPGQKGSESTPASVSPSDSAADTVKAVTIGTTVVAARGPEATPAVPPIRVARIVVVVGRMLRVPTIGVAPEPVPAPDPFAAAAAKDMLRAPPRTAFGTPSVGLPELSNRPEVTRALRRLYPSELRRAPVGGTCVLRVRIDEDGQVVRRYITATSGNLLLDHAALSAALSMHFIPARFEGRPVRSEVEVPITFSVGAPPDTTTRPGN